MDWLAESLFYVRGWAELDQNFTVLSQKFGSVSIYWRYCYIFRFAVVGRGWRATSQDHASGWLEQGCGRNGGTRKSGPSGKENRRSPEKS